MSGAAPDDAILFHVSDGLARITLNRPARLNAVDPEAIGLWQAIAHEVADRDDIGAVLFDANGRAFCAGGDVVAMSGLAAGRADAGRVVRELADRIHDGHRTLRESSKPIVAAVQGPVAGGGIGFMLVADLVVASEHATFASRYSDVGLTPDCGVSTLLPEAVGTRRALELTLTSRTRLVRSGLARSFQQALDDEARTIGAAFETPYAQTAVAAFAARSSKPGRE